MHSATTFNNSTTTSAATVIRLPSKENLIYNNQVCLGVGSNKTRVYPGSFRNASAAVKVVQFEGDPPDQKAWQEVLNLTNIPSNKHLLEYFCASHSLNGRDNSVVVAMEKCDMNLEVWVSLRTNDFSRVDIIRQITTGLHYLHSVGIVHGGVKPTNCLLKRLSGEGGGGVLVKLSDFGLSRNGKMNWYTCYSPAWTSPEILGRRSSPIAKPTPSSDIFPLGCILYYVLTGGEHPFTFDPERQSVHIDENTPFTEGIPIPLLETNFGNILLIKSMINPDPKKRPSCHAILSHPLFWSDIELLRFLADAARHTNKLQNCVEMIQWHLTFLVKRAHSLRDLLLCPALTHSIASSKVDDSFSSLLLRIARSAKILEGSPREFVEHWLDRYPFLVNLLWMGLRSARVNFQFDLENIDKYLSAYFESDFGKGILANSVKVPDHAVTSQAVLNVGFTGRPSSRRRRRVHDCRDENVLLYSSGSGYLQSLSARPTLPHVHLEHFHLPPFLPVNNLPPYTVNSGNFLPHPPQNSHNSLTHPTKFLNGVDDTNGRRRWRSRPVARPAGVLEAPIGSYVTIKVSSDRDVGKPSVVFSAVLPSSSSLQQQQSKSTVNPALTYSSQYLNDFQPLECLGRGGCGVVFKAQKKFDEGIYAVKRIGLPSRQKEKERVMREVKLLAKLDHQNIVRYFNAWIERSPPGWLEKHDPLFSNTASSSCELSATCASLVTSRTSMAASASSIQQQERAQNITFEGSTDDSFITFESNKNSPDKTAASITSPSSTSTEESGKQGGESGSQEHKSYLYIQLELCQKHTLKEWLQSDTPRDRAVVADMFSQILNAVEYVHSKMLIHRDLKPSNIFFADVKTTSNNNMLIVKIGDFGLVCDAYADCDHLTKPENVFKLTSRVGTRLYMSPEQYLRKPYDYKVDIYSLGLIYVELLCRFSTDMERVNCISDVRNGVFSERFSTDFPEEMKIIKRMVSHEPTQRPTARQVKKLLSAHICKGSWNAADTHKTLD